MQSMPELATPPKQAAQRQWIVNARFDGWFFFASAGLALLLGAIVLLEPRSVFPLWLLWLWLVEGPHVFATWQRTYFDAQVRQTQPRLLWQSLLWFVPAPLILALGWAFGQSWPFQLILAGAAIWSFHHLIRQHHGILAIYQRSQLTDSSAQLQDKRLLHACLWLAFGLFLLANPVNRQLLALPEISQLEHYFLRGLQLLLASLVVYWLALLWHRKQKGMSLIPGIFALLIACGTTWFSLFVIGAHEPLLPNPRTPEQMFMAATMINGTLHGLQYLGIVIATSRRRAQATPTAHSFAKRLGDAPAWAYAFLVLLSLPYVMLNLLRGGAPVGPDPETNLAQFYLAMYWGLFFHHYWLDQKIWKPSRDVQLQAELGLR